MKLYYYDGELTDLEYNVIKSYCVRKRVTFKVFHIREKACWCCIIDCDYDNINIGRYLANLGFKTLNIDAVLDDLDRLTNNYKLKENVEDED